MATDSTGAVTWLAAAVPRRARLAAQPSFLRKPLLGRVLVVGLAALALVSLTYVTARETSMFAVRRIEISGARGAEQARVRAALAPVLGSSLVSLDRERIDTLLGGLPIVASASYDRDFPHTLRVAVRTELPVAVLRRGADSWIVSGNGRVLGTVSRARRPPLPRIWLPRAVDIVVGARLTGRGRAAVRALGPLVGERWLRRVRSAEVSRIGGVQLTLHSGLEVRLGEARDLRLKLAVARRVVPLVGEGSGHFLDVSAPERPFAGPINPKVED